MNYRFTYRAQINASVQVAWGVFTEHEKYSEWTSLDWKIIKDGASERNGLGCIRQEQGNDSTQVRTEEVINYWVPNQLFGYHIISSTSFFDRHQGTVRFFPKGPNRSEWIFDVNARLTDEIQANVPDIQQHIKQWSTYFMHDIECECERRASDIEVPAFPLAIGDAARKPV